MINWIKYDPESPPQDSGEYLVAQDGDCVWTAVYNNRAKMWKDDYNYEEIRNVTHYAHINLPGEEDK